MKSTRYGQMDQFCSPFYSLPKRKKKVAVTIVILANK
jgi:hypothetical protein